MTFSLLQKLTAEFIGTALLLAIVIGSGIMGETLAGGNDAIALLGNTIATGAGLIFLIIIFGNISGAHFNPAVTIAFLCRREISWRESGLYTLAQIIGGFLGVAIAHAMFDLPIIQTSLKARDGFGQSLGEAMATFGLLMTILGTLRFRPEAVPYTVGLFITAGYWFTSSTSFANPAVTIARMFSNTFAGIQPADAPIFIAAQIFAALAAVLLASWLFEPRATVYKQADEGSS